MAARRQRRRPACGPALLRAGSPAPSADVSFATAVAPPSEDRALTVADVVGPGATVGVDESDLVHALLGDVVGARPRLVGSTSLAAVLTLTATPEAASGAFTVRLFGGEHRDTTGAFGGPRGLRAVTATACDVALIGGRLVGDAVWVPTDARPERLALLLASRRAYVVLTADTPAAAAAATADDASEDVGTDRRPDRRPAARPDLHPDASHDPGWTHLAGLVDFDGVLEVAHTSGRTRRSDAA